MNPTELRALADALDNIIGNGWNELLSLGQAISYLRAQADAALESER